ncbi:MAG: FAD-binding protein [Desulfobacteraceae bacterium]|nr:FAD-binding protein [Desulfobacteraceae bacterium]
MSSAIAKELRRIVGPANFSGQKEDRACYAYDATRRFYMPEAVIFPGNAVQVAQILRLATDHGFGVTPRGAGSGMSGGAIAVHGGLVMAMNRCARILSIDTENFVGTVEPGVVTAKFQRAVAERGLFYPPDPSSADYSTLGGNLAECAGGPKAVKYGVTRDYVLGLEVVLPTGEIIRTGVKTAKGVVGYDITRLLIGSEGTLGVITEMTLRLLPLPESVRTLTALFADMRQAARCVVEIMQRGIVPRAVEYMDRNAISCVKNYLGAGVLQEAGAMLLIETDGMAGEAEIAAEKIAGVLREHGAENVESASTPEAAESLWRARKAVSPALYAYGPDKINEDIVVPRSRLPEMVERIGRLSENTGLTMVSFGHVGDGNIHFNIMYDSSLPEQEVAAGQAVNEIFEYTLELGGTISGEHGVGIAKAPYMDREISPEALSLMKRIKSAFDPAGILNPGKMRL